MEWITVVPGVRHKIHSDGSRVLRLVEYSDAMEPHGCAKGHVGLVLEGRFEIEFRSSTRVFEAGDGVFIPNGEEHKARVLTEVVKAIFVEDV